MQIILVSRHLKVARTITIMPRHLVIAGFAFLSLVMFSATLISWLTSHGSRAGSQDEVVSQQQETYKAQQFLNNNLQLMATRLGELQAQVLHLDTLGDRLAGIAGIKREAPPPASVPLAGQGGAFVPAPLGAEELQREIDRLSREVDVRTDELTLLESSFLEKRVKERLLPTTLPVKEAFLGSPFGHRSDPILGQRAMHEGIDFNAESGTPVVVAADGVVLSAGWQSDFGNMIDVDHGDGFLSIYGNNEALLRNAGDPVAVGDPVALVGNTGGNEHPGLYFELRFQGRPFDPLTWVAAR